MDTTTLTVELRNFKSALMELNNIIQKIRDSAMFGSLPGQINFDPDVAYDLLSDYISDGQIVIRNRSIPKLLSQMGSEKETE